MSMTALPYKNSHEIKRVAISSKHQITIPQKFFTMLGFGTEAECIMRGDELVLRPVRSDSGGEFAEQILEELIREGYSGEELLHRFREEQRRVRPAVQTMLQEAEKVARSEADYVSYEDVFGGEEE